MVSRSVGVSQAVAERSVSSMARGSRTYLSGLVLPGLCASGDETRNQCAFRDPGYPGDIRCDRGKSPRNQGSGRMGPLMAREAGLRLSTWKAHSLSGPDRIPGATITSERWFLSFYYRNPDLSHRFLQSAQARLLLPGR